MQVGLVCVIALLEEREAGFVLGFFLVFLQHSNSDICQPFADLLKCIIHILIKRIFHQRTSVMHKGVKLPKNFSFILGNKILTFLLTQTWNLPIGSIIVIFVHPDPIFIANLPEYASDLDPILANLLLMEALLSPLGLRGRGHQFLHKRHQVPNY